MFKTRMLVLALGVLLALAGAAGAQEIPVPEPRPERPVQAQPAAPAEVAPPAAEESPKIAAPAPPVIPRQACPALMDGRVKGRIAPPLAEGDCGEDSPVEIESAAGIPLTGKPKVTCAMAGELAAIAEFAALKAKEILGSELKAIVTGPGYECRRRNRATTGKLSEHAFANALDIASFRLADGRSIGILPDWPHIEAAQPPAEESSAEGGEAEKPAEPAKIPPPAERAKTPAQKFLVEVHAEACARFTTVLGPDSNTAHEEHFHFDLGCHGRDCTYLICE